MGYQGRSDVTIMMGKPLIDTLWSSQEIIKTGKVATILECQRIRTIHKDSDSMDGMPVQLITQGTVILVKKSDFRTCQRIAKHWLLLTTKIFGILNKNRNQLPVGWSRQCGNYLLTRFPVIPKFLKETYLWQKDIQQRWTVESRTWLHETRDY